MTKRFNVLRRETDVMAIVHEECKKIAIRKLKLPKLFLQQMAGSSWAYLCQPKRKFRQLSAEWQQKSCEPCFQPPLKRWSVILFCGYNSDCKGPNINLPHARYDKGRKYVQTLEFRMRFPDKIKIDLLIRFYVRNGDRCFVRVTLVNEFDFRVPSSQKDGVT